MLSLAILLSGSGRTLENFLQVIARGELAARIGVVVSSVPEVRGLAIAQEAGIPAVVLRRQDHDSDDAYSEAIYAAIAPYAPDLILLAGFLRRLIVPPAWRGRILNIHPALLPGGPAGRGLYGERVHAAVLANGETESGASVHVVDGDYDTGPVVMRTTVRILASDTPATLGERVFAAECELYPEAVRRYVAGHPVLRRFSNRSPESGEGQPRMHMRTEKQPVVASRAVVTANHPEASAAGLEMLAMGGNAVDAAVATLFSLSVVEPMMVSPCGAGFFVIRDGRTGEVVTLDNYATVPGRARADMFTPVEGSLENETVGAENDVGYLAVGVPGALAGWCLAAERFGSLPLAELVAPAVRQARRGFTVSPYLSQCIGMERESLARFWATAATFLHGGRVPAPGDRIVRADYADTLERMGHHGAAELVSGETAVAMVADMEVNGGLITRDDLAGFQLHEREPVRGSYRGYDLIAMGPVSSGGTHIAQMLGILEGCDLRAAGFGTVETIHHIAEVLKIAFADRFRYMADPATVEVPVGWLTSAEYAAERCAEVLSRHGHAGQYQAGAPVGWGGESSSTTHLNVVDADGTMVSATQTLNSLFGSRVTTPGTGMLLNNCMRLMDPVPGRTNSIAPGKRILSSMSPTLILRDGKPWLAIGTPGGHRIFAAVMQGIINLIDHGMTVQEAVEAPRVWTMGPVLEVEDTFPNLPELVSGLERRGHKVQVVPKIAGGMSAILVDQETGLLHGGSCWRADGSPVGLSGGGARLVDETPWR